MNYVLGITLGFLCAVVGILGVGMIGYEVLWLFGFRGYSRRRLQLTALLFSLPAGIVGAYVGYKQWIGLQLA